MKLAVPFQDDDGCLRYNSVGRVDYFGNPSCPAQGHLSFLLDTMLQVDDLGSSPACALEVLDDFFIEIRPGGDGVLWEIFEPCASRPFQHHHEVTGADSFAGL